MTRSKSASSPRAIAHRKDSKSNVQESRTHYRHTLKRNTAACLLALFGSLATLSFSGCSSCHSGAGGSGGWLFSNLIEKPVSCYRDKVWAKRAFNLRYSNCQDQYPSDFRSGFIDGYCNACDGGDHHPPALPPQSYWTSRYSSAEGAGKAKSWFAGYPAGVKAASKDGHGKHHQIQLSHEMQEAITQLRREGEDVVSIESIGPSNDLMNAPQMTAPQMPLPQMSPPQMSGSYQNTSNYQNAGPAYQVPDTDLPPIVSPGQARPISTPGTQLSSPVAPIGTPGSWYQK